MDADNDFGAETLSSATPWASLVEALHTSTDTARMENESRRTTLSYTCSPARDDVHVALLEATDAHLGKRICGARVFSGNLCLLEPSRCSALERGEVSSRYFGSPLLMILLLALALAQAGLHPLAPPLPLHRTNQDASMATLELRRFGSDHPP